MSLKVNELVLCKITKIEGTVVFLDIEGHGKGTMIFSEVAAGRIRNIREYVTQGKIVVCKVLRILEGHVELSLRRVSDRERKLVFEQFKKEKILTNMLKAVIKDDVESIVAKIKEKYELPNYMEELSRDPSIISEFVKKEDLEKVKKLFVEKKDKEKEVKKTISLKTYSSAGVLDIQEALRTSDAEIRYLGRSEFLVSTKAKEFKSANQKLDKVLEEIRNRSKKLHIEYTQK